MSKGFVRLKRINRKLSLARKRWWKTKDGEAKKKDIAENFKGSHGGTTVSGFFHE